MRIFPIISYKLLRRKNLSIKYRLGILKCEVLLKRLFKSGVSL